MPDPRLYRTEAVVLRQRRLGEADKICVLFTPGHGRVEAVGRGLRRPRSRLAGHLEPLTRVSVLLAKGRSLDVITQAETVDAYPALRADLDRLSRAFYVAELVDRFTDASTDVGGLYSLLVQTLERLAIEASPDLPVRWFEMRLLVDQGYAPQLERCVRCDTPLGPEGNAFSGLLGGVICPRCRHDASGRPLSVNAFKLLRYLQRQPYQEAARVSVEAALARELEAHLREAVQATLDQDLKTVRFMETVRQSAPRRIDSRPAVGEEP